jgi:hypothetical protein
MQDPSIVGNFFRIGNPLLGSKLGRGESICHYINYCIMYNRLKKSIIIIFMQQMLLYEALFASPSTLGEATCTHKASPLALSSSCLNSLYTHMYSSESSPRPSVHTFGKYAPCIYQKLQTAFPLRILRHLYKVCTMRNNAIPLHFSKP